LTGYTFDRWDEWLARYSTTRDDGLWLSDGLGTVPDFGLHDLMADKSNGHPTPCDDQALLRSLAGVSEDDHVAEDLLVDGSWSSPDGVRVNVSSALVPPHRAILASRAVVTASKDVAVVARIDKYSIHDFQKRFTALSKSRGT